MKSKVYFTRDLTPEKVVEAYDKLGITLTGKVAAKIHSGEQGNQNYLHPEFWKPMVDKVHGTIVECNTAYGDAAGGVRDNTESHWKLLEEHGWTKHFDVDLMDAEGPDVVWQIPNGKVLKQNLVGKDIVNYDSMLVLAHFKGHPMGGYGGALKQLSIGCASRAGKALIHSAGKTDDRFDTWKMHDCCVVAEDPCMKDIGILASLDPVAIDQACIDLVMNSDDPGKEHFMERVNSRNGIHTIEAAAALGFGSREYELIEF